MPRAAPALVIPAGLGHKCTYGTNCDALHPVSRHFYRIAQSVKRTEAQEVEEEENDSSGGASGSGGAVSSGGSEGAEAGRSRRTSRRSQRCVRACAGQRDGHARVRGRGRRK